MHDDLLPDTAPRHADLETPLLRELAADVLAAEDASLAPATRRAYATDFADFSDWCTSIGLPSLPAHHRTVQLYVAHLAGLRDDGGFHCYKVSTITRRLSAIAHHHKANGLPSPTDAPQVAAQVSGLRRSRAGDPHERTRRMRPLLRDDIEEIVRAMGHASWPDGVSAARDTLIILAGFAGAFRRAEIAATRAGDVERSPLDGLHWRLPRSKTDQLGKGSVVLLPFGTHPVTCAPCAHARWVAMCAATSRAELMRLVMRTGTVDDWGHVCRATLPYVDPDSPLLRQVRAGGKVTALPMSGQAIRERVVARAGAAGYDNLIGPHSLRAGFVTQALRNGATTRSVMRQTRHRSESTIDVYDREWVPGRGSAVTEIGL